MTVLKRTLFFVVCLLIAASVASADTLRNSVTVEDDQIRLADLFAISGGEDPSRVVAPSPLPGRRIVFAANELANIAKRHNVDWAPRSRHDRVVVRRAGRPVGAAEIEHAVLEALRDRGLDADRRVTLQNRRTRLYAAIGDFPPFSVEQVSLARGGNTFVATLALNDGAESARPVRVTGSVYRTARIPVLAKRLRPGEIIGRGDIAWTETRAGRVPPQVVLDPKALIGKTPVRIAVAGRPLRLSDVREPVVVAKGALVTMTVTTPHMVLTAKGRALEDGAMGEPIRIANVRSNTIVQAVVQAPNRVTVTAPTIQPR